LRDHQALNEQRDHRHNIIGRRHNIISCRHNPIGQRSKAFRSRDGTDCERRKAMFDRYSTTSQLYNRTRLRYTCTFGLNDHPPSRHT
jgi:hypothetical protein